LSIIIKVTAFAAEEYTKICYNKYLFFWCAPEAQRIEQWTSNPIPPETMTPLKWANCIYYQKHCIVSVIDSVISIYRNLDLLWTLFGHRISIFS